MVWLKWFPWRFIVRRVARAHGFLDPIALLARLHRFAQPSKVYEPIKLLHSMFVILKVKINDTMIENMMNWHHSGFSVYCRHAIWPHNEDWFEKSER